MAWPLDLSSAAKVSILDEQYGRDAAATKAELVQSYNTELGELQTELARVQGQETGGTAPAASLSQGGGGQILNQQA